MAKQAYNIARQNTAAHGKIRRTRHNRAQTKARDGGKSPTREKREQGKTKTEQMCLGGFTR